MFKSDDPELQEAVEKMNRCCGPFARMKLELRILARETLESHSVAPCEFKRDMIKILASDSAEFMKRERLAELAKKKETETNPT